MPGRQSHGRPLLAAPKTKTINRSKSRSQKSALNAFNTASEQYPTRIKKTPRARELDAEIERKHGRDDDDEDEDEDDEEGPTRKKAKRPARNGDAEYGSDSEGNEWQLGGMAEDDEDSEIESDDAFGDSDNEKFEEYQFRGGKSKKIQDDDSEDDSNDDEGQTLGDEAIDLATALDQFEEEDSDEEEGSQDSSDDDEDGSDDEEADSDDDDDEEADPEKLNALQGLISGYGGEEPAADEKPSKQKIGFDDLGLSGLSDPLMRKSVKLMNKEEKEKRPGATKKLDVPLSRREQGRLDRSAAYETTNKTLDRWTETIQYNRRAEHLVFPLPENAADAGLDRSELQPLSTANPANELESAVMSIMKQSGLSLAKPQKPKRVEYDEEGNELTRREAANRRRLERELNSREAKRAKRIKKIKSKAYHRVHRKERERDELATKEAMEEAGELDSEAEREAQDRRRALERVGQRHKDSKWAKLGNKTKRAVWDDEFRTGLTEMAQRDEELRRRKEGKRGGANGDDSDATSSSGSDSDDDGDAKLRRQLAELEQEDDEPRSKLMSMKFMQKAEAARKQENDQLIKDIRKELDGDEASGSDSDDEAATAVGRRSYGNPGTKVKPVAIDLSKKKQAKKTHASTQEHEDEDDVIITTSSGPASANAAWAAPAEAATATTGAWSRGETRRKSKGGSARAEDLDLNSHVVVAAEATRRKSKPTPSSSSTTTTAAAAAAAAAADSDGSDSDDQQHLPLAERERALVARAFAGEDVVADFAREKEAAAADDDDRVVDATLPGWGAWVGEGVSKREQARNAGRYLRTVQGVVKPKDRRDAKLDKVVINEKTIKKNNLYRASQLPHPFETREQYERSLRLPVGPEWMTRETFQESTKPRVMIKQGVIKPMSKPTR